MFSQFSWNRPLYSLIYDLIFWSTVFTPWHYWPPKYFSFVWFLIFPFIHRCICFAHAGSFPVWETAAKCSPKRPNSWRWVCTDLVSLLPCGKSILKPIWLSGMVNFCLRSWNTLWSGLICFGWFCRGDFFIFPQSKWLALNILSYFDMLNRDSVSESELTKSYQFTLKELLS